MLFIYFIASWRQTDAILQLPQFKRNFSSVSFAIRTHLDPTHPFIQDRNVFTFESEPKIVRIADPKVEYTWPRVNARPIRAHIYLESFGSNPVKMGSKGDRCMVAAVIPSG